MTCCATGLALCVLEKRVHVQDPSLLPESTMLVCYKASDEPRMDDVRLDRLP